MDEQDGGRAVVESTRGVTLEKRFEEEVYPQPAVVYELSSEREEAATVRIIETIPDSLAPEEIGFLDATKRSAWQIKGPKLVLETSLEPGAKFSTVCGARGGDVDGIAELLDQPDVFEVEATGATIPEASGGFTRSTGGREVAANGEATSEAEDEPAADATTTRPGEGTIVDQLATELQAGQVSSESVELLRDELGPAEPRPRSVEARLKQLQTDISDVRAYTNALEAFLDENGSAQEVIERVEGRIDALDDTVGAVDERVDDHDEELAEIRERQESLATDVAALSDDFEELSSQVEEFTGTVEEFTGNVEEIASQVSSTEEAVERLEERLPEYDVAARIDEIQADVDDMESFANELKSVFQS